MTAEHNCPSVNENLVSLSPGVQNKISQKPILQPQRQLSRSALCDSASRHEDLSASMCQHLLNDSIRNIARWIWLDAPFSQLSLKALDDACCVPRWVDSSICDGVSVLIAAEQFVSEAFVERNDTYFCDAVVYEAGGGHERCHGGDAHDVAFTSCEHAWQEFFDEDSVRGQIHGEDGFGEGGRGIENCLSGSWHSGQCLH